MLSRNPGSLGNCHLNGPCDHVNHETESKRQLHNLSAPGSWLPVSWEPQALPRGKATNLIETSYRNFYGKIAKDPPKTWISCRIPCWPLRYSASTKRGDPIKAGDLAACPKDQNTQFVQTALQPLEPECGTTHLILAPDLPNSWARVFKCPSSERHLARNRM